MVAIWTQTLLSAAEMSNILSAISVVICLICTIIFIIRVPGMQLSSSVVHLNSTPVQVDLQKIEIPFTCFLGSSVEQQGLNEIQVNIKSTIRYKCQAFWSVNANYLQNFLYLPWPEFLRHVDSKELIEAYKAESLCDSDQDISEFNQTLKLIIDPTLPSLGKPPRSHFPLVLLIRRSDCQNTDNFSVGALLSIIHVSDADCPMATSILYHYLKLYSGQVTQLQSLYTQKVDSDYKSLISQSVNEGVEDDGPCVICRVMQPTRALLPCRHVCVCALCFSELDTCPLCRCRISAFFLTDAKEDEKQQNQGRDDDDVNQSNLRRHQSFLNNMNSALNSFLGIRNN